MAIQLTAKERLRQRAAALGKSSTQETAKLSENTSAKDRLRQRAAALAQSSQRAAEQSNTATGELSRVADPAIQRQREKAGSREEERAKAGGVADAGTLLKQAAQRREEQLSSNQKKTASARAGAMPGQKVQEETKTPVQDRARMDLQNSVYDQVKAAESSRLGKAAQSIGLSTAGSIPMLFDTFKQAAKNSEAYVNSDLDEQAEAALNEIKLAKALYGEGSPEYLQAELAYQELRKEIQAFQNAEDKALSKDSKGYQMMDMAAQLQEQALEGTTGAGRWLGEAAFSIADNAAMLPMAVINPMLPGMMMGAKAAAGRSKELTDKGESAGSALTRGAVSGAIESVTEQMGIDNLFDIVKTGGKSALKNLLKQAGVEGTEEGFSYLFNYMADELAQDPDAVFSPTELFSSIAAGAVSGLAFGAGGTVANRLGGGSGTEYSANEVISQKGKEAQAPAAGSLHMQDREGNAWDLRDEIEDLPLREQPSGQTAMTQPNTNQRVGNTNENVNAERSLTDEGTDISDARRERHDGAGAGESAGSLAEGAGRAEQQSQTDAGRRAKEARDLADALQITAQSPRSLGISRGTEDSTMRVIPRESRSEYMNQVADRVRQQTGREVNFFTGEMRLRSSNDRGYTLANGCILPDGTIYVQADNESLTAEQIADHETAHDLIRKSPGMMLQTIQQVQERYGNDALDEIVTTYLLNLRGIEGADAQYCQEELLCDAYAGINAFGTDVDALQGDVQQSFTDYRAGAAQRERGTLSQRGPPVEPTDYPQEIPRQARNDSRTQTTTQQARETNVTRDEETSENERPAEEMSAADKAKRDLLEAWNAGDLPEEEFDRGWADIESEPEMQDRERLSITEADDRAQEQMQRYQKGEISLDELRGYLNGMQAGQTQANKNTAGEGGVDAGGKIKPGMSDSERERVLQKKQITAPVYNSDNTVNNEIIKQLKNKRLTEAKSILRTLAEKCGAFQSDYYNADVELEFTYSKSSFDESAQKQRERHESMDDFGKMLTVLPEICSGAVEIEAHTDKYTGTKRADANLKEQHVLLGAFVEDRYIVPVQLEIKEYKKTAKRDHKLYVTVTVKNKEAGIETLATHGVSTTASKSATPASKISVADIVENINPRNGDLLRYLPDAMLTQEQIESKQMAQAKEKRRLDDMRYEYAVEKGYDDRARKLLDAKAEEQQYDSWEKTNLKRPGEVTFDDDGKLIPLSERFNRSNPDERYSVTEQTETAEEDPGRIKLETVAESKRPHWIGLSGPARFSSKGNIELLTVLEQEHENLLESLPVKGKDYLQRVERQMVNQVAKALGVPYHAKREYLMPIIQELTLEYMNIGSLQEETKARLFQKAWDEGIVVEEDYYNEYKPLKERLRTTPIMLAEQDRGDIPDWNNARKNMFGVLKIVNKGGITVDQAYEELTYDYPGMFPSDIRHPADRLQRMFEVGRDIRKAQMTLEQYYGPETEKYKAFARGEFENNLGEVLTEMRNVKRVVEERTEKERERELIPQTVEEVLEIYKNMKDARREYEKVNARQLLADADKELLNRAMRGEVNLDNIVDDGRYNLQGVKAVYEAKQKYEQFARTIRQYNNQRKAGLRNRADEFLKNAGSWKDKKAGILYARETMERNIRDIVKDKSEASAVIREFFAPVHRNEAAATRMKKEMRGRVADLGFSPTVQEGNLVSEAQAVKVLRQAEKNVRKLQNDKRVKAIDGKTLQEWKEAITELWKNNPKLSEKEIRQKMKNPGLSRDVRKGDLVSEAHAVQLLGEAEDNIRILQNNKRLKVRDGKTLQEWQAIVENIWKESPSLDPAKIRKGVETFREIYDQLFRQMNEVRVRNGYEPINFRSGYFPHFQAEADGILAAFGKALGIDTAVNALPTSINGITRNFKPGIRWVGNTLERIGFQTTYDAVEGFDRYIEGVADVIHHTDDIQKLRALASQVRYRTTDEGIRERIDDIRADSTLAEQDKENRIQQIYESGKFELGNFVVNLDEYTNLLANKKSESDRNMERMMGRRMYSLMKSLESRVAANMVALNPASWLTNFIPITQGGAQLGPTTMLRGMWNTLHSIKADDGMVAKSAFLTNRRGAETLVMTKSQEYSAALSLPMSWIDNFTAGSLVRARYEQNLKRGMSEDAALEEADEWVAGVMADRSKGSMPTLFHASNPLTKLFTQFQLEVNNQLSYLFKDLPKEQKEKGMAHLITALLKFFVGAWLYNEVYEYFIGRRPALDPIGILNEASGDLTGWELPNLVELGVGAVTGDMPNVRTEKEGAYEAVSGLIGNVAEELPFIGGILGGGRVPIQSALPDAENLGKVLLSDDWSTEKKWATAGKELLKPAAYLVPPVGGGQMKRAIEAVSAWWKGGSYTVNAQGERQLQYPVYNEGAEGVANLFQAATFGKTTLSTGRDWIENDFKTFSVNETAAYEGMVELGLAGEDAYNTLLAMRAAKKTDTESAEKHKQRVLLGSEISGDAKAVTYYFMFASDEERVMLDDLMARDANVAGAAEVLMQFKGCESSNEKRSVLMASDLTDWEKRVLYREKISDSREEEIDMFKAAGLDMDDFLQVHNQYTSINEAYSSAGDKATALSRWLNKQSFNSGQKETIKDAFKYYSQIPAEAARYDEFTGLGLSDDEAFRLTEDLAALKPMVGKKSVSNLQKWQTVVGAGLSADKQLAALESVMSESEYSKLTIGRDYGIGADTYVQFKAMLEKYDANGNGSYNQEEIEAAIDAMSGEDDLQAILLGEKTTGVVLTNNQKAVLWQLQSTSTSAKNNPYSRSVGEAVLKLKNGEEVENSDAMAELEALLGYD